MQAQCWPQRCFVGYLDERFRQRCSRADRQIELRREGVVPDDLMTSSQNLGRQAA